jgi:hypothetical protein
MTMSILDLNRHKNSQLVESSRLTQAPRTPQIEVERSGLLGTPDKQDLEDRRRAKRVVNLAKIAAAAEVGAAFLGDTGYQATVVASDRMEETMLTYSPETRTRQVADELYQPIVQLVAESNIAIAQAATRAMIATMGR